MQVVETGRPAAAEYAPSFEKYVTLVPERMIVPVLAAQRDEVREALASVSEDRAGFRYAEGKWSIRQVVGHLVDSERVFGYRALCVARGDQTPLPAFDENLYVAGGPFEDQPLGALLGEFELVRDGNLRLLERLSAGAWRRTGTSNGHPASARALAFVMAGHVRHHLSVVRERYLARLQAESK